MGSASAAATDATSSASALSPSRRSRRSSSRLAGMGNRSVGAEAKPRRSSASASSSAKKALPPDVSQSRTSVGRGSPRPRRARSSSCIAPMLSPSIASAVSRSAECARTSQLGTSPRTATQRADALPLEPCEGEPDGTERGGIEPLEVVDRETERVARSEGSQRREERSRDCSFVGLPFRVAEQQRALERPALDRGQGREHLVDDVSEEIGQPGVREARLRLGRPAREHAVPRCGRVLDAGEPDRGLPDPRLAVERDRRGKPFRVVEQGGDRRELVRPTDQRRGDRRPLSPSP